MAATITISARDESDGLQSSHEALLEVTPVPSDALFVVPGDEIPVDMESGFLKCGGRPLCLRAASQSPRLFLSSIRRISRSFGSARLLLQGSRHPGRGRQAAGDDVRHRRKDRQARHCPSAQVPVRAQHPDSHESAPQHHHDCRAFGSLSSAAGAVAAMHQTFASCTAFSVCN